MENVLPVFIGFDTREADGALVCEYSLKRRSSAPLFVQRLHEPSLRHVGLYGRKWKINEGIQKIDAGDSKPFSTDFSYSRFLVPSLMQHRGWVLFCDCDFLFMSDVKAAFDLANDKYAAMVVKHDHRPPVGQKMDGVAQQPYLRKNWSSLILWNCGHKSNQRLVTNVVNTATGQWLHAFSWLDDSEIGELPMIWNQLVGVNKIAAPGMIDGALHFTLGLPTMPGQGSTSYARLWFEELAMAQAAGFGL